MLPAMLLFLATMVLLPWFLDDAPSRPAADVRPPMVALVADAPATLAAEGFDSAGASTQVMQGAAARLRARGLSVREDPSGVVAVGVVSPGRGWPGLGVPDVGEAVTLSVRFSASANPWASGTETSFGGEGDTAWRLAFRVQRHLVGGLSDVLGYRSYDRGIVEQDSDYSSAPQGPHAGAPWVAARPLFATNHRERELLEWPETLDVLSTALADAVAGYLEGSTWSPPRDARVGWRRDTPWKPVEPQAIRSAKSSALVALTFDGGASSVPTPAILKALREAEVKATMFMTADFVRSNPGLVVEMARDGHEFGNHSSTHPDMTRLSSGAIVSELEKLETEILALTGKSTRPWFRPPFGAHDDRLVRIAAEQGYYTVLWTADSADWRDDVSAATVARRVLAYSTPGSIMIEHLGSTQSAQVLPEVLRLLKEQGIRFGTLSEVLGSGG